MTPLQQAVKGIERLTYAEMMVFAHALAMNLAAKKPEKLDPNSLADALLKIQEKLPNQPVTDDDKELRQIFSRARNIGISRVGNGWRIDCSTIPGATVANNDLRTGLHQLLDTLIVVHVLKK